jgi:transcriptional regulator with XRE-family HTH domain
MISCTTFIDEREIIFDMEYGDDFLEWVQNMLAKRNWSQAELARRGGITASAVSKLMTRQQRQPGKDMLSAIARAFDMPVEDVYRIAGEFPAKYDDDPLTKEAEFLMSQLPEDMRQQAVNFIRFLSEQEKKKVAASRLDRPQRSAS